MMYRTEVIKQVARPTSVSQRVVADVLRVSHQLIQQTLTAGESVTFPGFGTFYTREQPEGTIRHIQNGKAHRIPAHRAAAFRAGAVLRRAVRRIAASQRHRLW